MKSIYKTNPMLKDKTEKNIKSNKKQLVKRSESL